MQSWVNEGVGTSRNTRGTGGGPRRNGIRSSSLRGGTRKTNIARTISESTQMPAAMSPASQLPTQPAIGDPPPMAPVCTCMPGRSETVAVIAVAGEAALAEDRAAGEPGCSPCPPIHRCMPMMPVRTVPRHSRSRKECRRDPALPESITWAILQPRGGTGPFMATGRRPGSWHGPVSHAGTQAYPAGVWKTGVWAVLRNSCTSRRHLPVGRSSVGQTGRALHAWTGRNRRTRERSK